MKRGTQWLFKYLSDIEHSRLLTNENTAEYKLIVSLLRTLFLRTISAVENRIMIQGEKSVEGGC